MGSVMPKIKSYLFLSIFCLLINLCVFSANLIATSTNNVDDYTGSDVYDVGGEYDDEGKVEDISANATLNNFAVSTTSSFIPFFSVVNLLINNNELPSVVTIFTGVILGIISAFQIMLLTTIVLNLLPKVLGSGFDV